MEQATLTSEADIEALKQELAYYKSLIHFLPGNIYWKSISGAYLGCNLNMANILGLSSPADIIGKTLPELLEPAYARAVADAEQVVFEKGSIVSIEEKHRNTKGEVIYLTVKAPIRDEHEQVIGLIGNTVDITYLKDIEQQLIKSKYQAELTNQLKSEFIQNMQHDIRTPISGIWSVLHSFLQHPDPKALQEILPTVVAASEQLLKICNEVIDFENIAYGDEDIHLQPLNLLTLIRDIVELNSAAISARHLYLNVNIDKKVTRFIVSDEHRIKKILLNLLGNAVKFTYDGGIAINVNVDRVIKNKTSLIVSVKDTGIGIAENKKDRIFEKFTRLNPSNGELYKGSGLGLYVVKKFVEELGGNISVESELGQGSTFTISLPMEVIKDEHAPTESERVYTLGLNLSNSNAMGASMSITRNENLTGLSQLQPKILMIEDDPLALFAAEQIWQQVEIGFQMHTATNLYEAKQLLNAIKFDLVVSDLGLPDGSADNIVVEIKQNKQHPNYHTPMVALTAHGDKKRHKAAMDAGFNTVLCKPLMVARAKHILDIYVLDDAYGRTQQEQNDTDETEPVIDWDLCLSLANGKAALARELLTALIASFVDEQASLEQALAADNVAGAREMMHRFRGGLTYVGAPRLTKTANELHQLIKITEHLADVKDAFYRLFEEMTQLTLAYQQLTF